MTNQARGTRYDAIVIGAGLNGLTAAALLTRRGRRVVTLERGPVAGGTAIGREFHPGFVSAGLVRECRGLRPSVVAELELERHGLVRRTSPRPTFVPAPAGGGDRGLLLHHDPGAAAAELGGADGADTAAYAAYRAFFARIEPFTSRFLDDLPPDPGTRGAAALGDLLRSALALRRLGRRDMMELLRMAPMCVADWLGERFGCERLACALAGPTLDGAFMGPRSPGGAACLLRWEAAGVAAPVCDARSLVAALTSAAREAGAELRTDAEVAAIRCDGSRVEGVTLAGGEPLDAPIVAAACDPRRTLLELLDAAETTPRLARGIASYRMRGTTAQVNLALRGALRFACRPELRVEHARTARSLVEMERAFDAAKYGRCSDRPLLELFAPAAGDPPMAPPENGVVSILVHFAPHDVRDGWSDEARLELGDRVLATLEGFAPDVRSALLACEVLAPPDLGLRYGVSGGHVHQGEHALDQLLARPCAQCARYATPVRGLYLCGSGTHPGGGLAGVAGAIAAGVMMGARS
jgi:phytoene dehydrogenase-like protein